MSEDPHHRWGIVGPGGIATRFAEAMAGVDDGTIAAVASRSAERAHAFADRFGIEARHHSFDSFVEDESYALAYVATPHVRHAEDAIALMEGGKHVLCEKPFAMNANEARRMVDAARAHRCFLMEAMWSRFLPAYTRIKRELTDGTIGEPLRVEGDFGFRMPILPDHRLFDRNLGGGALLDVGIYPVHLCLLVLGTPERVTADAVIGATGVDEQVAALLHHPDDRLGVVTAAIRADTRNRARISGTEGWIELPAYMHCPDTITIGSTNGIERVDTSFDGDGLRFQIEDVHRCLDAGLRESATMPLRDTLAIAQTLDAIRAQIGLAYPGE